MKTVELKLRGMRKAQGFTVYPANDDTETLTIQSDTYIAMVSKKTGVALLSGPHSNGAYFYHLNAGKNRKVVKLDADQLAQVVNATPEKGQEICKNVFVG